jgi:hypothetical protein
LSEAWVVPAFPFPLVGVPADSFSFSLLAISHDPLASAARRPV